MTVNFESLSSKASKVALPPSFVPGYRTVLCGRGSSCTKSPGNIILKSLVTEALHEYSMAESKIEKSRIVTRIVEEIKESDGSFVKFEEGVWYEVSDAFAREKIGCMFRDALHTQYKSSTKAKQARKKARRRASMESSQHSIDSSMHSHASSSQSSYSDGYTTSMAAEIFGIGSEHEDILDEGKAWDNIKTPAASELVSHFLDTTSIGGKTTKTLIGTQRSNFRKDFFSNCMPAAGQAFGPILQQGQDGAALSSAAAVYGILDSAMTTDEISDAFHNPDCFW